MNYSEESGMKSSVSCEPRWFSDVSSSASSKQSKQSRRTCDFSIWSGEEMERKGRRASRRSLCEVEEDRRGLAAGNIHFRMINTISRQFLAVKNAPAVMTMVVLSRRCLL